MATITREMVLLSVKSLQARDREQTPEPRCYISASLILSHLERISDHAYYVGDSVHYT
jgi:phosphate transport system protein